MALWDALRLRPRLILAFIAGVLIAVAIPALQPIWRRSLIGWCGGVGIYVVLVVVEFTRASTEKIRDRASRLDDTAPVILIIALSAITASFGAISALLIASSSADKMQDILLAATTMVLSWVFTQIIFAVHYTHIFYGDVNGHSRGGLDFGGHDDEPDFWDFLYFTTSIGATAQTSDTIVTTKTMRRVVLAQSIYAFFFNTAVLALAVNIGAGLAGH